MVGWPSKTWKSTKTPYQILLTLLCARRTALKYKAQNKITEYLIYGVTLGLGAGIAPGPLLSLVISETLRGNRLNGILIALAPLITDLPIVIVSILILSSVSSADLILGILSLAGGCFILYVSYDNFKYKGGKSAGNLQYSSSLKYGVVTNVLSPHPYIFWITVGAPTFVRASKTNLADGIVFILAFYLLLIGSKIVVAHITEAFNGLLQGKTYILIMRIMGFTLFIFACIMIFEGIRLLF